MILAVLRWLLYSSRFAHSARPIVAWKIRLTWSNNGPKSIKIWSNMVPNRVQDGLLGIRAVKRRSWTDTPTVNPIHVADFGGLLGSCWGSCWAYVGTFFRDDFLMPFGRRFGPQHGRKSRPKSSPRPSPRRPNFGFGTRCQKWSKMHLMSVKKSLILDVVFDDVWMRCMSRICFDWHERISKILTQKHQVLERFLNIDHFAWTWDCLRNLIEDEAEIGLVCSLILEDISAWFLIDFEVDLGSEINPKWGRKSSWKGDRKKKGERWAYRSQLGVQDGVMLGWKSKKIGVKKKHGK